MGNKEKCINELNEWLSGRDNIIVNHDVFYIGIINQNVCLNHNYFRFKTLPNSFIRISKLNKYLLEHITPILRKYDIKVLNVFNGNYLFEYIFDGKKYKYNYNKK